MSFTLIPGEKQLVEDEQAWYYGGYSAISKKFVGHLVLTDRRLVMYEKRSRDGRTLETLGLAFSVPTDGLLGVKVEERVRSKWSRPSWRKKKVYEEIVSGERKINQPPGMLESGERYLVLMMSFSGESSTENPVFEVADPLAWMKTVERIKGT